MHHHSTRSLGLMLTAALLAAPAVAEPAVTIRIERPPLEQTTPPTTPPFVGHRPAVDVAILLDTSNSMDGLIDQAKRQLWTIVGQFAAAEKAGQTPHLRVGLFEYGNTNLPASEGYLRQVSPLTDDLDALSAALFGLTTNGGDEYCGQVIEQAVAQLDWSTEPGSYKAIFIAGNEPFTQGTVDYRSACAAAIQAGVVVNTIHCGSYDAGVSGMWSDGAKLAEGKYLNIDQDRAVVEISSPHDEIIIKLNAQLNRTYLWYGEKRAQYGRNQEIQDSNAAALSPVAAVSRAVAKNSSVYDNRQRDLVDRLDVDAEALAEISVDALPEPMQTMTEEERKAYVEQKAAERATIQAQLTEATQKRDAYVAAERKRMAEAGDQATLGDAVTQAVQEQLRDAGFEIGRLPEPTEAD
ncbi:MAG: VWA domain-containing protein [Planctomycetota bacterium]